MTKVNVARRNKRRFVSVALTLALVIVTNVAISIAADTKASIPALPDNPKPKASIPALPDNPKPKASIPALPDNPKPKASIPALPDNPKP